MPHPGLVEFGEQEYMDRLTRVTAEMKRSSIDALLLTTEENTRYFSGFRMITWDSKVSRPGSLVITQDGHAALVCACGGYYTALATTMIEDVRPWDRFGRRSQQRTVPEAIVAVLREFGVERGRIGLEMGMGFRIHLNVPDYRGLLELLSGADVVDGSSTVWRVRSVKSPAEIAYIRRACEINCIAFEHAFRSIRSGTTEEEIMRMAAMKMLELGAERIFPLGIRAGADRYAHANSPPGSRPVREGEIILIDGGPRYRGYFSDIIREAVLGKPSPRQAELFEFSVAACLEGLKEVRAGVTPASICARVDAFVDSHGFGEQYVSRGSIGHSIGLDIHELPLIDVDNHEPLKEGMVLAIEPSFYEEGAGMFNIEENVLVTKDGYELLTPLSHDLWVLPT